MKSNALFLLCSAISLSVGCDPGTGSTSKLVPNGQQQRIEMMRNTIKEAYLGAAGSLGSSPEIAEQYRRQSDSLPKVFDKVDSSSNLANTMEVMCTRFATTAMRTDANSLIEKADRDVSRKMDYLKAAKSITDGGLEVERLASYNPAAQSK
jgi:hypothetical protein